MTGDTRVPLRQIAQRLSGYRRFRNTRTRGKQELLKLLQQGEIRAAFDFPSTAHPSISIPPEFWLDVRSGQFQRQLTWKRRTGIHRQYLVEPTKFIDHYVDWFNDSYLGEQVSGEPRTNVSAELKRALAGVQLKKEVYILESEWDRFVHDAALEQVEHHDEPAKSTRGRRALESWEVVLVEVASELLARQAQGLSLEQEQSNVAAKAVARAEKLKKGALFPDVPTVAKKIRQILDGMDDLIKSSHT
jgi:hypothetical protein